MSYTDLFALKCEKGMVNHIIVHEQDRNSRFEFLV